ncbi:MAG: hypothetical protein Q4D81_01270 [Eubacteriales bacterium]|nr:hypothetical protein [Eubacteriales bacterium]
MMFRFESRAFRQTTDLLQTVCGEFDEYEERIRDLCRKWERNPDMPAPRERLRTTLGNLEKRETSLNLLRRKLETTAKIYEDAEQRILDDAEEKGIVRESAQGSGGQGAETDAELFSPGFIDTDLTLIGKCLDASELLRITIRKLFPKYPPFRWIWPFILPRFLIVPHTIPFILIPPGPDYRPRPPRPFIIWPPRRPGYISIFDFRKHIRYDPESRKIRFLMQDGRLAGEIRHPEIKADPITSASRRERRSRIRTLFGA